MIFLITLAQVGGTDPEVDSPLKKAIWFVLVPLALFVLIFGGGYWMRNLERRDRAERERMKASREGN